jgi:hypothetical protein
MNMLPRPTRLLGVNLANSAAASAASVRTSNYDKEVQSFMTDKQTFIASDFIHASAELQLLARFRGLSSVDEAKASARRRAKTLARACRVFMTIEDGSMAGKRAARARSNSEINALLPQIKHVLSALGARNVDDDIPGIQGFRRALRDYERACFEAEKVLEFITNNN